MGVGDDASLSHTQTLALSQYDRNLVARILVVTFCRLTRPISSLSVVVPLLVWSESLTAAWIRHPLALALK